MKKLILITQIFIGATLFGQGNLQFNRAVKQELTCTTSTGIDITGATVNIVVPVGKTLKITSAVINNVTISQSPTPSSTSYLSSILLLDEMVLATFSGNLNYEFIEMNPFPLWLPAGTYVLKILYKDSGSQANKVRSYISGIEFNIIP